MLGPRLRECGIAQGDRLCVAIPNGAEAAVAFLAMSLFCTFCPLNVNLTPKEFAFEFEDLPAKALVLMRGHGHNPKALQCARDARLPVLELCTEGCDAVGLFALRWHEGCEGRGLPPLPQGTARLWPQRSDVALVLHTSGTTKRPKIVPLTHRNLCCGGQLGC